MNGCLTLLVPIANYDSDRGSYERCITDTLEAFNPGQVTRVRWWFAKHTSADDHRAILKCPYDEADTAVITGVAQ